MMYSLTLPMSRASRIIRARRSSLSPFSSSRWPINPASSRNVSASFSASSFSSASSAISASFLASSAFIFSISEGPAVSGTGLLRTSRSCFSSENLSCSMRSWSIWRRIITISSCGAFLTPSFIPWNESTTAASSSANVAPSKIVIVFTRRKCPSYPAMSTSPSACCACREILPPETIGVGRPPADSQ